MKKMCLMITLLCPVMFAHGATVQQSKMTTCNADAKDRKGGERKAYMKDCLSAKPAAVAKVITPQQNKMKTCNMDAKDKKGADRKAFMSTCLKAAK